MTEDAEKILTVAELIAELQKCDPALPVWHEGCDCMGSASKVSLTTMGGEPIVLIERN